MHLACRKPASSACVGACERPWASVNTQLLLPPWLLATLALVMELDTAAGGNFLSTEVWNSIGQPILQPSESNYQSASKHPLPIVGAFPAEAKHGDSGALVKIPFLVSEVLEMNLLGCDAIKALNISPDNLLYTSLMTGKADGTLSAAVDRMKPDPRLQQACAKLFKDYTELFKQELKYLRDFELEINFKLDAKPVFFQTTVWRFLFISTTSPFHRYSDCNERPISNVSKILTSSQSNYSQIQKEALAIIFSWKKFFQYLFGWQFILITDHKPLLALFGPSKPTPSLAANRLAQWICSLANLTTPTSTARLPSIPTRMI